MKGFQHVTPLWVQQKYCTGLTRLSVTVFYCTRGLGEILCQLLPSPLPMGTKPLLCGRFQKGAKLFAPHKTGACNPPGPGPGKPSTPLGIRSGTRAMSVPSAMSSAFSAQIWSCEVDRMKSNLWLIGGGAPLVEGTGVNIDPVSLVEKGNPGRLLGLYSSFVNQDF